MGMVKLALYHPMANGMVQRPSDLELFVMEHTQSHTGTDRCTSFAD